MGDGEPQIDVFGSGGLIPTGGQGVGKVGGVDVEVIEMAADVLPLSGKGIRV